MADPTQKNLAPNVITDESEDPPEYDGVTIKENSPVEGDDGDEPFYFNNDE